MVIRLNLTESHKYEKGKSWTNNQTEKTVLKTEHSLVPIKFDSIPFYFPQTGFFTTLYSISRVPNSLKVTTNLINLTNPVTERHSYTQYFIGI